MRWAFCILLSGSPRPRGLRIRVAAATPPAASTWPLLVRRDLGAAMNRPPRLSEAQQKQILRDALTEPNSERTPEEIEVHVEEAWALIQDVLARRSERRADS